MPSITKAMGKLQLQDGPQKKRAGKKTKQEPSGPFRFFDLPPEIRQRIYWLVIFTPRRRKTPMRNGNIGASRKNPPRSPLSHRINLFLASRRMHDEAADFFYSSQTFRLFHIQDYSRMPTVRSIAYQYLPSVATIELILGSSWTEPPESWKVDDELGLEEMVRVKTLKIFAECDPSHPVFEGFRISKEFYTDFAGEIVHQALKRLPNLVHVEFDGFPSVYKNGALMKRLLHETRAASKQIKWGPQRGWHDYDEEETAPDPFEGIEVSDSGPLEMILQRRMTLFNSS